jgi:ABC-type nickel/cobalt efflux system permease component RcnA
MTTRPPASISGVLTALGLAVAGVVAGVVAVPATPAGAHPAEHAFQVSQYEGLTFLPDEVRVVAAMHTAEIVTRQDRRIVDADHDGKVTDAERGRYARTACAGLAAQFTVEVNSERLVWTVVPGDYRYEPGSPGLPSARLTCRLAAPARLSATATVGIANDYRLAHTGWRELTAVGQGVRLVDSLLPRHSVSDELRAIPPADVLVVDVRTAVVRVEPGSTGAGAPTAAAPAQRGGPVAADMTRVERRLAELAGGRLTPLLVMLAVLAAVLLGAGHAALPGHGKTVLAAYLAGRRGRLRDAIAVGGMVTISHTGVVLVVGVLLSTGTALVGGRLLGYLGVASGLLVLAVGVGMLVSAVRQRAGRTNQHGHEHGHGHGHGHGHHRSGERLGMVGIGMAGGLVPSPSALVVLLASVGMGRAVLGVLLVLAYGLGMAVTLTATGLILLAAERRMSRFRARPERLLARLGMGAPAVRQMIMSGLVLAVGAGLAVRAAAGFA